MKFYEILKTSLFRALCALRALLAWRVHVLGVLACFRCSSAWSALRNSVLGVLGKCCAWGASGKI